MSIKQIACALSICLLSTILLLPSNAMSANHYILDGGSGDGTSWSSAWDDLPDTFVRGDTYYVAAGSYGTHTFSTSTSGTTYIYIKKATVADHGTDTGWSDAYASGQAIFSSANGPTWTITTGRWYFDGITGTENTEHGIKVATSGVGTAIHIPYNYAATYLVFRHLEVSNKTPWDGSDEARTFWHQSTAATNTTIQYCYIYGGTVGIAFSAGGSSGHLIEYSYVKNVGSNVSANHSTMVALADVNTATIRYNIFDTMVYEYNTCMIEPQFDCVNIHTYGNVFKFTSTGNIGQGIWSMTSTDTCVNCTVYNNTAYNLTTDSVTTGVWGGTALGQSIIVRNNVWKDCTNPYIQSPEDDGLVESNNSLDSAGITFVDAANGNFHLTAETPTGYVLTAPFDSDPDGNTRGVGNWDIGAYEYGTSVSSITGISIIGGSFR